MGGFYMAAVNYTIRLDETDKQAAERVFNELGLTLAAGLNVYVKAVARQRKIPFDLALNENTGKTAREQKETSFKALSGLLAGHEVDLDRERAERILSR
jgi:DNA-damage-inducible protein J